MEQLLYFSAGNREKEKELQKLSEMLGIGFIPVSAMQAGQQIGFLLGLKGFFEKKLPPFAMPPAVPEEMLVISGMTGERMDSFLAMLRGSSLSVPLKAVVTPYNVGWSLADLGRELCAERAEFEKRSGKKG